ncbi:MAG: GNAT family N-acetyltransferase [Desulfobacterales bacterium]|nr:GNAT family N-acetyltransferase [Desulfobacterales bacterium]
MKVTFAYFSKLPLKDRACLRDDVTDPAVISRWVNDLDYDEVLPLVARDNGKIIGSGTSTSTRSAGRGTRLEVRLTTDVNYRERGLGTHIAQNLIDIATELGLEQLSIEMSPDLRGLLLFEKLGFKEAAVLKGFVRDLEGNEANLHADDQVPERA